MPSAPAASAANASVGVVAPGRQSIRRRLASVTIETSPWGITTRRPPASQTRATSARQHRAGADEAPGRHSRRGELPQSLSNGRGELSGTSRMRNPRFDQRGGLTAAISGGVMPRRTATNGSGSR